MSCVSCGWDYVRARERAGVYRRVSPLFYYPSPICMTAVCRWCARRWAEWGVRTRTRVELPSGHVFERGA